MCVECAGKRSKALKNRTEWEGGTRAKRTGRRDERRFVPCGGVRKASRKALVRQAWPASSEPALVTRPGRTSPGLAQAEGHLSGEGTRSGSLLPGTVTSTIPCGPARVALPRGRNRASRRGSAAMDVPSGAPSMGSQGRWWRGGMKRHEGVRRDAWRESAGTAREAPACDARGGVGNGRGRSPGRPPALFLIPVRRSDTPDI